MSEKFNEEFYIPDEDMKIPKSQRMEDSGGSDRGVHLLIILGVAISVVLVVLAGIYLYDRFVRSSAEPVEATVPQRPTATKNQEPESDTARADVDTLEALSPSDQLSSIITDLENTRLENLDIEINAIEDELR